MRDTPGKRKDISGLIVGKIVIAAYPSICVSWLPDIICRFQEKYPGVTIRLDDSIRVHVLEELNSGRADIGFLSDQHDFEGEWTDLQWNPMVALVSEDSEYAAMEAFPLSECEKAPMIQSSHGRDKDLDMIFEKYHIRPNIVYITRNSLTAAAMAQNNMGVLLVNELSTHMWPFRLKVLPLDPPQQVMLGMAVSTMSTASPAVKTFARFVRDYFRDLKTPEKANSK